MRKLLSVLSSTLQGGVRGGLLFLLFFASVSAIYASDTQVDGIWYDFDNSTKTASVTYRGSSYDKYSNEYSGAVVIPETVTYNGTTYSVTSIGDYAFHSCRSLTSITIPNSVTSIGEGAFFACSSLTSPVYNAHCFAYMPTSFEGTYVIPEGIKQIAGGAFVYCSSLTSITIPNSVTSIGDWAFSGCSSLTSVTIPNSVTSIGDYAFEDCSSLTSITIGNSVTSIGRDAFEGCSSLTKTNYTGDIAGWCNIEFEGSDSNPMYYSHNFYINDQEIKDLVILNTVDSIHNYAFCNCRSLTSVTIPESVTSIGGFAFDNCSSLTSVTIPESVTSIGDDAFYGCSSLTSITIPNSVTSIGYMAFSGCSALTKTNYTGDIAGWCDIKFGGYGSNPISYSHNLYINGQEIKDLVIPNTVNTIRNYAFYNCSSLTSINIPNSVTSIGDYTFRNCKSLTSVTIPNSVTSIGSSAFQDCSSLTSVTIPNSVTSIGSFAFRDCSSLTSVTIPNSVTSIGGSAFSGCSSLNSITIPNSVTSIGYGAFSYCSSLTSITCEATIPPTLGSDVFYQVSKSIPVYVPCGCASAYKVASVWKAFTNFQEPQAEYSIQVSTSNSQMGTAKVDYNNCAGAQISAVAYDRYHFVQWSDGVTDNPRTLTLTQDTVLTAEFAQSYSGQCGDNLYWIYDEGDQSVSITGSGGMYDYTSETQPWLLFKEQIIKVTTSNTATSIGTSAFEGCIRLGKVTLSSSIQNIAAKAFAGCTRLYDVYCYATYPPFADATSFANYNAYLYVPCENQRDYTLDMVWGNFKFIECITSEDVSTDGVVITPTTNDVTITWPTEGNADTYTIVIKKGNEVFCTLTFNAEGQLLNIAFAPGRNGNHPAQYAEQAGNGYRFTVTGLEEGTHYAYNIDVRDAANKTIKSHIGEFTTESMTAVENITTNNANIQKILRDGQLLILRDGVEYTIMGQEL